MAKKVVVQVRLPAGLVEKLDMLTEQGLYRDRTEAITDGIRHLIEKYSKEDPVSRMVSLYLMGKLSRNASIDEVDVVNEPEDVRRAMKNLFGTDNIEEILSRMRGRFS
ncbi:MAG: ribbon-helix-helix domain-containing protein [Candidatus Bathyarchaeia archaeon]